MSFDRAARIAGLLSAVLCALLGVAPAAYAQCTTTNYYAGTFHSGCLSATDLNANNAAIYSAITASTATALPLTGGTLTGNLRINLNSGSLPARQTGTVLQVGNANATATRIEADAFGAPAFFTAIREDGTAAAPTTLQSGDEIGGFNAWGYNGTAIVGPRASLRVFASQNWTTGAAGTYADIATTPNGSNTMTSVLRFDQDGGMWTPGVTGGDEGAGTINAAGLYVGGVAVLAGTVPVNKGGTGITAGTSGGVLCYTASGTLASSGALAANGIVYGGGAGVCPSATAVGTAGQVLTSNGTGVAPTFQAGGGLSSTSPLTLSPTSSYGQFTVSGANSSVALTPTGTGSVGAQVQDGTSVGGNARGANAVDWQQLHSGNATTVASGARAVVSGGSANTASGADSNVAGGFNNIVNQQYGNVAGGTANSVQATGGAITGGNANTLTSTYGTGGGNGNVINGGTASTAFGAANNTNGGSYNYLVGNNNLSGGNYAYAQGNSTDSRNNVGVQAFSGNGTIGIGARGRAQIETYVFTNTTSGSAAVQLTTDGAAAGSANIGNLGSAQASLFTAFCIVTDTVTSKSLTYTAGVPLTSLIQRPTNAASTAVTLSVSGVVGGATTGTPPVLQAAPTFTADTTNGGLNISYTPPVANTDLFYAVCQINYVTTRYN